MGVEFCRALSAALFGVTSAVEYSQLSDDGESFNTLAKEKVDVCTGGRVSLSSMERGLVFSSPYYYDNSGDAFALVTRNDDNQWSAFVYWIVMSTFYAEENNVNAATADSMPIVNVFGESFRQMFRDCILAVGNYGDIYERTLSSTIPRSGQNQLNLNPEGPQVFPIPFV
jgi:hypothetical protein